ncbi:precorrin-2 dehydrogenase/sirohydrochlorin ferrochelatase family protein [Dictyobacter aurantiacus]|uniref:precorrin-2 dehydrogenase n=1 Tax=Dictyobacter aurantiacus TaxID=1936993 RepID=A0A401ZGH7_9CHLR|nr:bifunctional precorrin-2 dehydrogenase/sirohydrochlorin ferrochelatase [Dictyobacter aurantiacus]GCE05788.1 precorrin-2 oxidase [Dictyobacter aurantiacus]
MPDYYSMMLDVRERPVLVVGGNAVAAEKAAALCAAGAHVTVLNPEFCPELQELASRHPNVTLRQKAYEQGDLAGAFVVVAAATYEPELAEAIWQEAQQNNQLVNIVDLPARCNFIVPSILRRGPLTISVSTGGTSPGLAKRIRQQLEKLFPVEYATYMRLASIVRVYLRQGGLSYAQRDEFFGEYFNSDILDRLIDQDEAEACASVSHLLQRYHIDIPVSTIIHDIKEAEHEKH